MKRYLYLLCFCILVVSSSTPISAQIGAEIKELKVLKGKLGAVWHVTYSPDGTRVAGTAWKGVGGVHVWDAATGKIVVELNGHVRTVFDVVFRPERNEIVTCTGWRG